MATKKHRYMISVTNEMFEMIEDFHYQNRFKHRSDATTELIRLGLEKIKKDKASDMAGNSEK